MKNKFNLIIIICVYFGCTNYEDMLSALETKQGLDKLKKGMLVSTVVKIIGSPYDKLFTADSTEVWFYVTAIPQTAFRKSPKDLPQEFKTALVFRDNILIDWGDSSKKYIN